MALNHRSDDPVVASCNLAGDLVADFDLTRVVLLAVGMAQIDHHPLGETCCGEFLTGRIDARRVVVGLFSTTEDNVYVFITKRRYNGRVAGLCHGQEMMRML